MQQSDGQGTTPRFEALSLGASFSADDLATSLAWYRDVVGFTVDQEHVRDGVLRAISLRAGSVRLLLTQDDGAKGSGRAKGEGFSLMLTTRDDIDALAAGIVARGGTLVTPPADAFGARVFRARDPNGFLLVFSSERRA